MEDDQSLYFRQHAHAGWNATGADHLGRAYVRRIESYVVVIPLS